MGRTDRLLQMNRLSLRSQRLKFKTAGKFPIVLEQSMEYTSKLIKKNWKISTCSQLDLDTLGSRPIMHKNLPGHCSNHKASGWLPRVFCTFQRCRCFFERLLESLMPWLLPLAGLVRNKALYYYMPMSHGCPCCWKMLMSVDSTYRSQCKWYYSPTRFLHQNVGE